MRKRLLRWLRLLVAGGIALLVAQAGVAPRRASAAKAINFTIRDLSGKFVRLSDFKDKKLVYMSFWATWCQPCLAELKLLRKLHDQLGSQGFVVLAISLDGPETRAKVPSTVRRCKLGFPVMIDTEGQLVRLYNPKRTLPFSVMIKKGQIIKTRATFQLSDGPLVEKEIREALR